MKLKFAAITASILMLCVCTTPIKAAEASTIKLNTKSQIKQLNILDPKTIAMVNNTKRMHSALIELEKTVGKTWYVFSGETPAGWDCSGLTRWFYKQMGVTLEHRASIQAKSGNITNSPKPGDIVAFRYKGYHDAYHVGIYIGNGKMIHAPKHGHVTRIENISNFINNYSSAFFIKILQTT